MGWSLPIFRVAGIQLRIHVTFLLLIGWLAFGYYAEGGSAAAAARVLFILLLFACVVLHEFGHALAAKAFGINTPDITLLPIGGVARLERMPEKPMQELGLPGWADGERGDRARVVCDGESRRCLIPQRSKEAVSLPSCSPSTSCCSFNLPPAFPMDGGRLARVLFNAAELCAPHCRGQHRQGLPLSLDASGNLESIPDLIALLITSARLRKRRSRR
jgi:stage IV sporulation protein FB